MLKVAVIGTGLIATLKHLPAWKRAKDFARVVALCDVDMARAAEVAANFGIPSTYANTREMRVFNSSPHRSDFSCPRAEVRVKLAPGTPI
jgi:predicted dehydrogenase